jgi:hypothetical protein
MTSCLFFERFREKRNQIINIISWIGVAVGIIGFSIFGLVLVLALMGIYIQCGMWFLRIAFILSVFGAAIFLTFGYYSYSKNLI